MSGDDAFFFSEESTVKLDQHAQEECEGPLTKEELMQKMVHIKNVYHYFKEEV